MSPMLVRICVRAAHRGALMLGLLVAASACGSEQSSTPLDGLEGHASALLAPPAAVAKHAQYARLSEGLDAELTGIVAHVVALPPGGAGTLRDELLECLAQGRPELCLPLLDGLDVSMARIEALADTARTIAHDTGLEDAPLEVRRTAFMGAQEIDAPIGPNSALVAQLVETVALPCGPICREQVGNGLGVTKGSTMARMSQPAPTSGDNGGGGGGGGGGGVSAGTVIVIVEAVIEAIKWIEDVWWNSDEEDKACENDGDCPASEYCHKVGDNDCRDKLENGQLCSRSGQCESGRCRVNISCGFLPCCRP